MARHEIKLEWVSFILYLLFLVFGWVNIYSSSFNPNEGFVPDMAHNYGKQLVWIGCALILALVVSYLDPRFIEFTSYLVYGAMILALILVLIIGKKVHGSRSWFDIGGFLLQPSEFAKIATAMALSRYISSVNFNIDKIENRAIAFAIIGVPAALTLLQPDTGTTLVFLAFFLVLYREGLSTFYLILAAVMIAAVILTLILGNLWAIGIIALGALLSWSIIFRYKGGSLHILLVILTASISYSLSYITNEILLPHQKRRIEIMLNPEEDPKRDGYNVIQSKIAIGSGGFYGKGFQNGTQTKFDFVPEKDTDFIFCTVGEEYGWMGSSFLLLAMLLFLYRIIYMAENSKSKYARVYGYAVACVFFVHIAINVAMTIGLAPVIGIPLPFFSYGGSSLWSFTIFYFILHNHYSNRSNIFSST